MFLFHYKKLINDILSCAAIPARQRDSIMNRITRIIRPIICMAVLLFAMTTAVMGCYQKETEPVDIPGRTPSGTSAPQPSATPTGEVIPSADRQAELAEARAKNLDAVAWLYMPGTEVDDPVMQADDNGYYLKLDEDTVLTPPPAVGSTTRPTAAISGLWSWQSCCRRAQPHRSLACLLWMILKCPKRNQNTTIK